MEFGPLHGNWVKFPRFAVDCEFERVAAAICWSIYGKKKTFILSAD